MDTRQGTVNSQLKTQLEQSSWNLPKDITRMHGCIWKEVFRGAKGASLALSSVSADTNSPTRKYLATIVSAHLSVL